MLDIAVFSSGIVYEYQKKLIDGIRDCANEQGYNIFVFTCNTSTYQTEKYMKGEYNIFKLPDIKNYKGAILVKSSIQHEATLNELLKKIRQSKVPTVVIDGKEAGMINIGIDEENAMSEIITHLIEVHGAKKINYISDLGNEENEFGKLKAYRDILKKHGLQYEQERIYFGDYQLESGAEAVKRFIEEDILPDAIVCANDRIATEAFFELNKRGIRVPEDILLTGFDNDFDAKNNYPEITSVEKPQYAIGYLACDRIIHAKHCEEDEAILPALPFYSQSCGCSERASLTETEFRQNIIYDRKVALKRNVMMNDMTADLTCLESYNEFLELLKLHIERIHPEAFFLCLCGRKENYQTSYFEQKNFVETEPVHFQEYGRFMYIPIIYRHGKFSSHSFYESETVLPVEYMNGLKGKLFVAAPIHFMDHCYGYCIIQNSEFALESDLFYTWIMSIGIALENVWKHQVLQVTILKLEKMWVKDNLTDVYNRSGFYKYAPKFVESVRNDFKTLCVMFIDIDGLKAVNDQYGHEEGDYYIRTVTDILKKSCESEESLIMRYGGDEFVILLKVNEQKEVIAKKQEMQHAFNVCNEIACKPYIIGASIGWVLTEPVEDIRWESVLEKADQEMYKVKRIKKRKMRMKEGDD